MEDALDPDSALQFEAIGSNIVMAAREPDGYDPLAGADVIVRGRFENQRLAVVPMEGAAIAVIPGDDGDGPRPHRVPRVPDAAHDPRAHRQRRSASSPSRCA